MTQMQNAKRTVEVGCGPGRHSLMLANSMLRHDGGVLVSCDFSQAMCKKVKENYESPAADYSLVEGNKSLFESEER